MREQDRFLREAFALSAFTLLSGFIGVSISEIPDDVKSASLVFTALGSLGFLYYDVVTKDQKGFIDWFLVLFFGALLWGTASALTNRPYLVGGIVFGWLIANTLFRIRHPAIEAQDALDEIKQRVDDLNDLLNRRSH